MTDAIELNLVTILQAVLLFVLLLWIVSYRYQRKEIRQLEDKNRAQQEQLDIQDQTITEQKVAYAELAGQQQAAENRMAELEKTLKAKESMIDALNRSLSADKTTIAELEIRMAEERKAAGEKLALLEDAKEKLGNEFKLLANQIFEEKGKALGEQSRNSLDAVLKPMQEQFKAFRSRIDEIHTDESKERATLKAHLLQLEQLNRQMSEDAVNLTQALKGDSKAQGNWGEMTCSSHSVGLGPPSHDGNYPAST